MILLIEKHFRESYDRLLKKLSFRAGTIWAAEDVLMEAYYRAIKYQRSFDGTNFERWFQVIVNNALRESKNQEKGYTPVEFDEDEDEGTQCTNYSGHIMAQVYELIQTKSLVQIEILMLYFHQEYTAKDISRITNYKYAQIHQIIQRFRNELKDLYHE